MPHRTVRTLYIEFVIDMADSAVHGQHRTIMDLDSDARHVTVTLAESGRVSDCLVVGSTVSLGWSVGRGRRGFACVVLRCVDL